MENEPAQPRNKITLRPLSWKHYRQQGRWLYSIEPWDGKSEKDHERQTEPWDGKREPTWKKERLYIE